LIEQLVRKEKETEALEETLYKSKQEVQKETQKAHCPLLLRPTAYSSFKTPQQLHTIAVSLE
jgi:5-hydroxyisourate hydrolase-like protein (transthyretin family)